MYHDVTAPREILDAGREWFAVTEAAFERQLASIREAGLAGSTLEKAGSGPPAVGITFDDGMLSDYRSAFPRLATQGMTATFFVVSDLVGTAGRASWSQLREMRDAGMSIQSHTRTHPFLSELSRDRLLDELAGSKARIDDELGQETTVLALPGGDAPSPAMVDVIREAGYHTVATSRWGINTAGRSAGLQWITRCTVAGRTSDDEFARIIRGDRLLALRKRTREFVLRTVRDALGPSRYAALRRKVVR